VGANYETGSKKATREVSLETCDRSHCGIRRRQRRIGKRSSRIAISKLNTQQSPGIFVGTFFVLYFCIYEMFCNFVA